MVASSEHAARLVEKSFRGRFRLGKELGASESSLVCVGTDLASGEEVSIKLISAVGRSRLLENFLLFQRQARTFQRVSQPRVAALIATEQVSDAFLIVESAVEGMPLDRIGPSAQLPPQMVVALLAQVAEALEPYHEVGLLHGRLAPSNLVLSGLVSGPSCGLACDPLSAVASAGPAPASPGPASGESVRDESRVESRIVHFGHFVLGESPATGEEPPERCAYLSPERVGMLPQVADGRSDIYSLGVVAYRLLAGRLPFDGRTTAAYLHRVMATRPPGLRARLPGVHPELEKLVLQMIARRPEDRPTTTRALRERLEALGGSQRSPASSDGRTRRESSAPELVERQAQLRRLEERFDLAVQGQGSLVALQGNQGDGRTRLVEEIRGRVESAGGVVLRSQALPLEQGVPFHAVREMIEEYVGAIRRMSPDRRADIATRIESAVGDLGGVLVAIAPEIREILSSPPGLVRLDPARERQRLVTTVLNFFLGVASREHPILLFLDDLQWIDSESRELVAALAPRLPRSHLLCVVSVAEGEPSENPRREPPLDGAPGGVGEDLVPAVPEALREILASIAERVSAEDSRPPLPSPHEASQGGPGRGVSGRGLPDQGGLERGGPRRTRSPHEVIRLEPLSYEGTVGLLRGVAGAFGDQLQELADLAFERANGNVRFTMEIARVFSEDLAGVPLERRVSTLREVLGASGARDVFLRRIDSLEPESIQVLARAAVIGRRFGVSLLASTIGEPEPRIRQVIERALLARVISPHSRADRESYRFADQAVHEDLYEKVDRAERRRLHERIGDLLAGHDEEDRSIFEAAYHYLRSGNRAKAAETSIAAADRAKGAHATSQAVRLYSAGLEAAREAGVTVDRPRILESLGDCYTLQGRYEQAEEAFRDALRASAERLQEARLHGKIGEMFFRRGDNDQAVDHLLRCLESLGCRLPRGPKSVFLSIAGQLALRTIRAFLPRRWRVAWGSDRKAILRDAVRLHHTLAYACYFKDIAQTLDVHLRQLNLAERLGTSTELAQTYSDHGVVCSIVPLHRRAQAYQIAGLRMRETLGDQWGVGQSHGFLGVCAYGRAEWSKALLHLGTSRDILTRLGDQWEVQVCYFHLSLIHRLQGDHAASVEDAETLLAITRENKDRNFQGIALICRAQALCQIGDLDSALADAEKAIDINDNLTRAMAYRVKAQVLLRLGLGDDALSAAREGIGLIRKHHIRNEYVVENFVVLAEALASRAESILAMERRRKREELREVAAAVRKAVWEARLFPNHLGAALRVRGTLKWLRGDVRGALADFHRSLQMLDAQGSRYQGARTRLEAGRWLARVRDPRGRASIEEAIRIFRDLGARRDLDEAMSLRARSEGGSWDPVAPTGGGLWRQNRQLGSLFKISRTIASILEVDRLLTRAVDLAIEVLGAERGFLLLSDGDAFPSVRVARDLEQRDLDPADCRLNREVLDKVSEAQEPVTTIEDAAGSSREGVEEPRRSILCVPLRVKDRPIGMVYVDNRHLRGLYEPGDADLLSSFAAQLAVAIENAEAYRKIEELNIGLEEKVRERTSELLRAKLVLEKTNRMKDEFLANMSHELRTPLNAVIALSDILFEETFGPLNDKQRKYVGDIIQSSLHLLSLINDILDLSKIEAGRMQLQPSTFDLNALLRDSLVMVKEKASKHRIALSLDLDTGLTSVRADQRKVKQIVYNLLSNAVKFTEDGGRVTIRSRRRDDRQVRVTVEDTGIGIAQDDLDKIFVEFQQIDSSLARRFAGTGLGLALSKRFVELHGGSIWVESEPGRGSRFSFSIPMMVADASKPEGAALPEGDSASQAAGSPQKAMS